MTPPVLYYLPVSSPCHLVLLIAKRLNVELKLVNAHPLLEGCPDEYFKVNPTRTIPALDDNGFYLPESRAIAFYLLEQYGENDPLLPKDPKAKALVLQRLIFDEDLWNRAFRSCARKIMFESKLPEPDDYKKLDEGLGFLDKFLDGSQWIAGNNITLADYSALATLNYIDVLKLTDLKKFPNVDTWFGRVKRAIKDYDEIVAQYAKDLEDFYLERYNKLKAQGS